MNAQLARDFMEKYYGGRPLEPEDVTTAYKFRSCGFLRVYRERDGKVTVSLTRRGTRHLELSRSGAIAFCDSCIEKHRKGLEITTNIVPNSDLPNVTDSVEAIYPVECDNIFSAIREDLEKSPEADILETLDKNILVVNFSGGQRRIYINYKLASLDEVPWETINTSQTGYC